MKRCCAKPMSISHSSELHSRRLGQACGASRASVSSSSTRMKMYVSAVAPLVLFMTTVCMEPSSGVTSLARPRITPVTESSESAKGSLGQTSNFKAPSPIPPTKGRISFHCPTEMMMLDSLYSTHGSVFSASAAHARGRVLLVLTGGMGKGSGERYSRAASRGVRPSGVGANSTLGAAFSAASAPLSSSPSADSWFFLDPLRHWRPRGRLRRGCSMWQ
mmetsp:Transcript_80147/g.210514  ORF Transcript_80147/g.210514 Transcript_80147/m.210514 type:complete len:218 (+) Transcript_80147:194-847(+)